ncbi:MAG TPA: hypothetical protein VF627_08130 [Abditibacterium sp.]|jgi:hypothetical protein
MRFIPTKIHAALDYLAAITLIALPRALNWDTRLVSLLTIMGITTLIYTLLTRFEGGVARVLPTKFHLLLDFISGAGLASLPFWMFTDVSNTTRTILIGLGLFEIVSSLLTKTHSTLETADANYTTGHTASAR